MPCAWVLADALYGSDSRLRRMLEQRGQAYVLAVRSNHCLRLPQDGGLIQTDPETLANALDTDAWTMHAAGEGAKGLRLYDWARIALPWVCYTESGCLTRLWGIPKGIGSLGSCAMIRGGGTWHRLRHI